jgi:hypothetical protein
MTIDLNDPFLIFDLAQKNYYEYGKLSKKLVISDIICIFVFTRDSYIFYVKIIFHKEITIQARSDIDFLKTLKNIVVGDYNKEIKRQRVNLKTIFDKNFG